MIYVVSGMYRSGTSCAMEGLRASGQQLIYSDKRTDFNERWSDEFYRPNPHGPYECSMEMMKEEGFPRQHDGCAIKMVFDWLHLLAEHEYRVIVMERDAEEIRQSFEAAFNRKVKKEYIEKRVAEGFKQLARRKDIKTLVVVPMRQLVLNPLNTWKTLKDHGFPVDPEKAAAVADPELYRFRLERLVEGV